MEALFVLADAPDLVDLLADLMLAGALALIADLVRLGFDFDFFFLLPLALVSVETPNLLLAFFDASATISPFLVLFFSDPAFTALTDFVDFLD